MKLKSNNQSLKNTPSFPREQDWFKPLKLTFDGKENLVYSAKKNQSLDDECLSPKSFSASVYHAT